MESLFFDCFSGAAGDMLVASLLDQGASFDKLREGIAGLALEGVRLERERAWQGGLAGTRFHVIEDPEVKQPRRNLPDIRQLLQSCSLPAPVIAKAQEVFQRLGAAEAKVHGCDIDEVHFHEVGAVDSIVDIVSFCFLVHDMGSPSVYASPVAIGEGFVQTEHGKIPVPAMATMELLVNVPVVHSGISEELVTPTGAALLSSFVQEFGRSGEWLPKAVGYGLGTRIRENPPNAVRVIRGERAVGTQSEWIAVLETNLDDVSGQEIGRLIDLCLRKGALDVVALPAQMKKGRPGHLLQVLTAVGREEEFRDLLFRETPALGVRYRRVQREVLCREESLVDTSFGAVRVKSVWRNGEAEQRRPEFDELQRLASETGQPLSAIRAQLYEELK